MLVLQEVRKMDTQKFPVNAQFVHAGEHGVQFDPNEFVLLGFECPSLRAFGDEESHAAADKDQSVASEFIVRPHHRVGVDL